MLHSAVSDLAPGRQRATLDISAEHLVQYEIAHEQLLKAVTELAGATQQTAPDRERYTAARWRIVQASGARLALWDKVRDHLFPQTGASTRELLSRLAVENVELRKAGSAVIAGWSTERIESDWGGYCQAARQMRWKQMQIVRHERRDLIPILQHLSQSRRNTDLVAKPEVGPAE